MDARMPMTKAVCLCCYFLLAVGLFVKVNAQEASWPVLEQVDFKLNPQRNGQLLLSLSDSRAMVDIRKREKGLSIELLMTRVEDSLLKVFDVTEFGSIVHSIEVFRRADRVELFVVIEGEFEYEEQFEDKILRVTVNRAAEKTIRKPSILDRPGPNLSLNFHDIPVRNVLQLIADHNNFNLVVSDAVVGNLTLRLEDVAWRDVFEVILQLKGLDKRVKDNVVLVAPRAEFESHEQQVLQSELLASHAGELESEIIDIKFAQASEIAALINGEGEFKLLSSRGSLGVDERTNAILIRDTSANIKAIRAIVNDLDVPIKQVQIEARIVTVSQGNLEELGIRWGYSNANGSTSIGASIEDNHFDLLPIDDMLNVNLAATSTNASTIAFQVAKLGSDMLLDLELSALQRESKAEVISSPRLITTNKKPAFIEQGSEIPYLESSSSGATSVSFKKAVLSLKVTPQITPDNRLILDLNVTQDRPGEVVKTGTGEAVAINTQRIGTQVLVDNGETVVLGGIFQHSVTDAVEKVPFLGDLPLLGTLFRRTYQQEGKSELLIFVTPRVVME